MVHDKDNDLIKHVSRACKVVYNGFGINNDMIEITHHHANACKMVGGKIMI